MPVTKATKQKIITGLTEPKNDKEHAFSPLQINDALRKWIEGYYTSRIIDSSCSFLGVPDPWTIWNFPIKPITFGRVTPSEVYGNYRITYTLPSIVTTRLADIKQKVEIVNFESIASLFAFHPELQKALDCAIEQLDAQRKKGSIRELLLDLSSYSTPPQAMIVLTIRSSTYDEKFFESMNQIQQIIDEQLDVNSPMFQVTTDFTKP